MSLNSDIENCTENVLSEEIMDLQLFNSPECNKIELSTINKTELPARHAHQFRTVLSQVLAITCINFILLSLGMILALPTIIIPDLLKSTEDFRFSNEQASWFGSLAFIFQPVGSGLSGLLSEPVGRRGTMMYVNIPLAAGWLLLTFSSHVGHLYAAQIILGTSIGFMDAPHITYVGEVTQAKWRGILTSYAELCVAVGFCTVYFMGTCIHWRTVSAISCSIPIISVLVISRIPESPIWLLSKKRVEEALTSLCWLRGWVEPQVVTKEFIDMKRNFNLFPDSNQTEITHENDCMNRLKGSFRIDDLLRKPVLVPALLVATYFGFSHIAGITNTRPYIVEILKEFRSPVDPVWVTAISSAVAILGFISGMILVPRTGKRRLSIISMSGCALINTFISFYGFFFLHINASWIPILFFISLNFFWSFGIGQIPWMLISEVFPFRGRGMASGIVAAISYIQAFVFIKTYYNLCHYFSIPGAFAFYALCSTLGVIFIHIFLPETEGKALDEIQLDFQSHFNKIFTNCC